MSWIQFLWVFVAEPLHQLVAQHFLQLMCPLMHQAQAQQIAKYPTQLKHLSPHQLALMIMILMVDFAANNDTERK